MHNHQELLESAMVCSTIGAPEELARATTVLHSSKNMFVYVPTLVQQAPVLAVEKLFCSYGHRGSV